MYTQSKNAKTPKLPRNHSTTRQKLGNKKTMHPPETIRDGLLGQGVIVLPIFTQSFFLLESLIEVRVPEFGVALTIEVGDSTIAEGDIACLFHFSFLRPISSCIACKEAEFFKAISQLSVEIFSNLCLRNSWLSFSSSAALLKCLRDNFSLRSFSIEVFKRHGQVSIINFQKSLYFP